MRLLAISVALLLSTFSQTELGLYEALIMFGFLWKWSRQMFVKSVSVTVPLAPRPIIYPCAHSHNALQQPINHQIVLLPSARSFRLLLLLWVLK